MKVGSGNTNRTGDHENEKDNATLSLLITSLQNQTKSSDYNKQKIEDALIEEVEEAEHDEVVPDWLHPLTKSLNMTLVIPNSSNATTPDLELSLAVPKSNNNKTMEQDKTSKSSFLIGPISVT
ncbi:hypothetical protein TSUD_143620 [Trifolium subterraneum]|uniref:Uncharacterized protein n=1 Tax=Trifolium subterraneum TaxID=3900 RepID=A0A2Z6MDZ7_TRISU|nr:hypothetical protein TSUD_143620 [Trifolium subterraneum]